MTKSQKLRADILAGKTKFLHVSVLVGTAQDPDTKLVYPTRTPKGKGGTARRNPDVETLCGDHCHISNIFRGWLCDRCNVGIDNPVLMEKAADYVRFGGL